MTTARPDHLNPLQWNAVTHDRGPLLIIAGPGTGKTHTLTHRIVHIARALPEGKHILAITFTNKAAWEMRQRLSAQTDIADGQVSAGTFHQCCLDILRSFADKTGLPKDFHIAPPEEIEQLSKDLWPEATAKERKMKLVGISQWKAMSFDKPMPDDVRAYNAVLRKNALLDFDDLLLETLALLRKDGAVPAQLRQRYAHIFIDEYQDINAVQHAFLKMLVAPGNTITAIGDPNQAIYGFRGCDAGFFERFTDDFPGTTVLSLSENYRSGQNILSASIQVMAGTSHARVPDLTANIYAQGRLTVHAAATEHAEAEYVTHQIERMVGGTSMFSHDSARAESFQDSERSFGDIAVLYRLNSQRAALKKALDRSGIPYQVSGITADGNPEEIIDQFYVHHRDDADVSAEKVSLMTLHASKGLEFPVVFVVGCEDNLLPLAVGSLTSDPEEDRRLFYVGMTRAKEELFLTRAGRRFLYGHKYTNAPSPFLADIEEELKEYAASAKMSNRRKKDDEQLQLF